MQSQTEPVQGFSGSRNRPSTANLKNRSHHDSVRCSDPSGLDLVGKSDEKAEFALVEAELAPSTPPDQTSPNGPNITNVLRRKINYINNLRQNVSFSLLFGLEYR